MDRAEFNTLAATLEADQDTAAGIVHYLNQFGYLEAFVEPLPPDGHNGGREAVVHRDLTKAIEEAQRTLGLVDEKGNPSGIPDAQTLKAMQMTPRCGRPDFQAVGADINRWAVDKAHTGLKYCIEKYINTIPRASQDEIIAASWQAWERACWLQTFAVANPQEADIIISCSSSRQEEFGTAGNVLAWAYLPQGSNHDRQLLCKFDLAERWGVLPTDQGILLLNVATHEFGHLLGLDHTQIRGELMFPTYDRRIFLPQPRYDVPQVVERYESPRTTPTPPTPGGSQLSDWEFFIRNKFTREERKLSAA